ncbi:MAG: methylmalonyl Co-A mutase-associated GTPase MeaB, partial [Tateyamaria sp.]|nr:methylmalonyl Co-A mutase-associated GTPase MeaB [Tateyamaria sp.]
MDTTDLAARIVAGERRALARGITLVESTREDQNTQAAEILASLPRDRQALRIGLSGTPGVGKSTFIESFGMMLVNKGMRVAVLA